MTDTRHSERSEESSDLSELISKTKVTGFNKSIPLFTSPLIRGEHNNPSLSREGFGMGFVQKNGAVNSINRSRIECGMTNIRHPELVSGSINLINRSRIKYGMTNISQPEFSSG